MDANENEISQQQQPIRPNPMIPNLKHFTICATSFLVLFLAISITIPNTSYTHYLKNFGSTYNIFQRSYIHNTQSILPVVPPKSKPTFCVLWMAPFLSSGGYSSEAWSYITALNSRDTYNGFKLGIEQHGDLESFEFWSGLPKEMRDLGVELYGSGSECRMNETIVVCHSEPGAWYPPLFETSACPPTGYEEALFVIGRTMFETDRVNVEHVKRCNRMGEVWVPTDFHVKSFIESGVEAEKVVKVVQAVDVKFFDPDRYKPLDIGKIGKLVLGSNGAEKKEKFVFLSIFKWEYRKGWDLLLKSYLQEFTKSDNVALYLLTNAYHSDNSFGSKIFDFVVDSNLKEPVEGWASVYVISSHIAQVDLPRLYKAADAFVLPTRGEGWGRPLVEAMAMSLPVIATNWSGPTEYLTEGNSYPLHVDKMSEVTEGPFKGHMWAEPSVDKLKGLMRNVVRNPVEAKGKGMTAREDMTRRFSPEVVAGIVINQIMISVN